MNTITNRQAICDTLLECAKEDKQITVVCSDSRGSASLAPFFATYPKQSVEVGIAEQNLVTISAGLASCGKKVFAASPASFVSTRSYEQAKVDVAYSGTNVTLIGISGGISYGALGMTHHSCQDIAAMAALPGMRVYLPSDRFLSSFLIKELLKDEKPSYIRVSRSASDDLYDNDTTFTLDKANVLATGEDVLLVACGEMVSYAKKAKELLTQQGIHAAVIDMYCIKPFDQATLLAMAQNTNLVITIEEHSILGGLGSIVAQTLSANDPKKVINLALPDDHLIAGESKEVFSYYGLDETGIANTVKKELGK